MISTREVKGKIKTTRNIIEITSALEVVSIIRMKRSQEVVKQSKKFIEAAFDMLKSLMEQGVIQERKKEVDTRKAVMVITSDKGLCGPFNINVIKKFNDFLEKENLKEKDVDLITVGKWGYNLLKRRNFNIIASFQKFGDVISLQEILPIAREVFDMYSKGKFSQLYVVYTDFITSIKNVPRVKRVLPYDIKNIISIIEEIFPDISRPEKKKSVKKEYIFEPDAVTIMKKLEPFLFQVQMFYFITESNATEHSLRMMAMKNAKETASSFLKNLTLLFNKARQEKITSELIEITSAKELL